MARRKLSFIVTIVLLILPLASFIEAERNFDGDVHFDQVQNALLSLYPLNVLTSLSKSTMDNSSSSTECYEQARDIPRAIRNGTSWALQMIDASSKIPSGIMMGNHIDLGMYDECIAINGMNNGEEIRGRHCMYNVLVSLRNITVTETLSICVPSSCGRMEVELLLNTVLRMITAFVDINIPFQVVGVTCSSLETPYWTTGGILTLVGFSVLLLFLVLCTVYDVFETIPETDFSPVSRFNWMRQFSLYSNAVRILNTKKRPQTLPGLQGLRFFSMCWVLLGHEYFMSGLAATMNPLKFFTWIHTWNSMYIIIATFSVDTFFTISGFLISYLFMKEMSTGRRFNIFAYYIHRYLRLTPALAALLLMMIFIVPRVGSGAVWERMMDTLSDNCRHNWWPMMLYVHNYIDKDHLWCLAHTWYLAVEMHFFWISPLILYPLARKPKLGLVILAVAVIASIVTPPIISYENKYSQAPFASGDFQQMMRSNINFYLESHVRAAPYLIGITYGYLVFVQQGPPRKIIKQIGWLLSISAFAFCFFSMRVFQAEGYVYNDAWETFYVLVSRPFWSVAVGWIIYASVLGFGGPITSLLSFSIYDPFSRISYCVYLVHFVIQIMRISSLRTLRYFSDFSCFSEFLTDFSLAVIVGFIFTLMIESPILTLEKIIRRRERRKLSESKQELRHAKSNNGLDNPSMERD